MARRKQLFDKGNVDLSSRFIYLFIFLHMQIYFNLLNKILEKKADEISFENHVERAMTSSLVDEREAGFNCALRNEMETLFIH